MMLASSSTSLRMRFAASSTSNRVMSRPPVMLISTPRAPRRLVSSSSGLEMAASAAFTARSSPSASPVPIIALPISAITVRMSAKSRFTTPGLTIRSVTPRTPMCRTLSAILKASAKVVRSLAILNRFWFGMTMSVSTNCCSSSRPASEARRRFDALEVEGLGDDADGQDAALARHAGDHRRGAGAGAAAHAGGDEDHVRAVEMAAPAPPSPPRRRRGRSRAWRRRRGPASGAAPSCTRRSARLCSSACASVFATTNSTPSRPVAIMLLTALVPPPPTPMTVMRGREIGVLGDGRA